MTTFTDMTILADHPVRKEFAGCIAVSSFETILESYGLRSDYVDLPGDHGRIMLYIWTNVPEDTICVGRAVIAWGQREPAGASGSQREPAGASGSQREPDASQAHNRNNHNIRNLIDFRLLLALRGVYFNSKRNKPPTQKVRQ